MNVQLYKLKKAAPAQFNFDVSEAHGRNCNDGYLTYKGGTNLQSYKSCNLTHCDSVGFRSYMRDENIHKSNRHSYKGKCNSLVGTCPSTWLLRWPYYYFVLCSCVSARQAYKNQRSIKCVPSVPEPLL